jgi:hypothetical protein
VKATAEVQSWLGMLLPASSWRTSFVSSWCRVSLKDSAAARIRRTYGLRMADHVAQMAGLSVLFSDRPEVPSPGGLALLGPPTVQIAGGLGFVDVGW